MVPSERALASSYRPRPSIGLQIIPLSAFVCPKFQIVFLGKCCKPPILGKRRPYGQQMVPFERALASSYRPSVMLHSKFSSIFMRFRDIAAFVLQHVSFCPPTSICPKFPHVPLSRLMAFWANCLCNNQFPRFPTCDHNAPTSDGQRDGQHVMARLRFALQCIAYRVVKTDVDVQQLKLMYIIS